MNGAIICGFPSMVAVAIVCVFAVCNFPEKMSFLPLRMSTNGNYERLPISHRLRKKWSDDSRQVNRFSYGIDPNDSRLVGAQWQQMESGATRINREQRACRQLRSHLL